MAKLLFFLSISVASGALTGFHVDDESCSGLLQDNKTKQLIACQKYFDSLSELVNATRATSHDLGRDLKVKVDTGTGWVCPVGATNCFNITYAGRTKSVAEHVMDLVDEVVLMDYSRDPAAVVSRAAPFLKYADGLGHVAVSIGLAIASATDKNPESWRTRDEAELEELMSEVGSSAKMHKSFKRFAVFTTGDLMNSKQTHLLSYNSKAIWYMDHENAINTALGHQFLSWAKARNVKEVYVAPEAGTIPLIYIPGVEGSAATSASFCNFIREADAQGLDVQLFATPTPAVVNFMKNCSLTPEINI